MREKNLLLILKVMTKESNLLLHTKTLYSLLYGCWRKRGGVGSLSKWNQGKIIEVS